MSKFAPSNTLNWLPFKIGTSNKPRPLETFEGVVDRIRIAAFAERQAFYAFSQAAIIFANDVCPELIIDWLKIAEEEAKHEGWLLKRLEELNQDVAKISVSLGLYNSFCTCKTAEEFTLYITDSENKGRNAGLKFVEALQSKDPITAKIFQNIADEEVEHIALASKYFSK
jgi:uncharacterized ferritin-like protein (DUF455 family)